MAAQVITRIDPPPPAVIPAQAGIQQREQQVFATTAHRRHWIPACAGMTVRGMGSEARMQRFGPVEMREERQAATPPP
jgi:hypothetical protein